LQNVRQTTIGGPSRVFFPANNSVCETCHRGHEGRLEARLPSAQP